MWIPKGAALIRGWHLFETQHLLEEMQLFRLSFLYMGITPLLVQSADTSASADVLLDACI